MTLSALERASGRSSGPAIRTRKKPDPTSRPVQLPRMKFRTRGLLVGALLVSGVAAAFSASEAKPRDGRAPLIFAGTDYLHRWSKDDQHEFTPHGQEDLARWADMITIHHYRSVKEGESLASTANAVLENYKRNGARVLRTDAVPRTAEKPAEYLLVVLFPRPDFIETVFARFKLVGGIGSAAIYSHREYGQKIGDQMSAWLQKNGSNTEKALMAWEQIPPLDAAKN